MVILCDQYFINHVRNIFETLLVERLSLPKCVDMLEFAKEYNCKLLKKCSLEFMVQNMARVLEYRILEDLDFQLLKEIGELYRKEFNINESVHDLSLRLRNDGELGDVLLESFVEDFTVDLNYKAETKSNFKTKDNKQLNNNAQERRNYEKEAKEAIKNLSIESNDTNKKVTQTNPLASEAAKISDELLSKVNWTKVSEKKNTKKKGLVASPKLNEVLQNEQKERDNFVFLNKKSPTSPIDIPATVSRQTENDDSNTFLRSSFNLGNFTPTKRMTQKQRKSFPLHSNSIDETATSEAPKLETDSSTDNAWGSRSLNDSFANIIKSPNQTSVKTSPISIPHNFPGPSTSFFQSPPQASTSSLNKFSKSKSSPCEPECFSKILEDERKEREYYEKLKTKPLVLTQIEETAIDELKAFYNIENVYDEAIRVERTSHTKPTMNFAVWRR